MSFSIRQKSDLFSAVSEETTAKTALTFSSKNFIIQRYSEINQRRSDFQVTNSAESELNHF